MASTRRADFLSAKFDATLERQLASFVAAKRKPLLFSAAAGMADVIVEEVRENVPVDTGLLKSAIYQVHSPEKTTDDRVVYRVSWNRKKAPHGHLVEFGTRNTPAQPFVRPALSAMDRAIAEGLKRMRVRFSEEFSNGSLVVPGVSDGG